MMMMILFECIFLCVYNKTEDVQDDLNTKVFFYFVNNDHYVYYVTMTC